MAGQQPPPWLLDRLADAPFAVLGTHGPDGRIDLVPCCFALIEDASSTALVTAVDHKPKRTERLARLSNIERTPTASLLVDHRERDWSRLWWVRASGPAVVHRHGPDYVAAVDALVEKYPHYGSARPQGAAIRLTVEHWSHWAATAPPG